MLTQPLQLPNSLFAEPASAARGPVLGADDARRGRCAWLDFLCLTLLGYAVAGKGFAYVGLPPLFIGDAILLVGVAWLLFLTRSSGTVLSSPPVWLILLLMGWGLARTWRNLERPRGWRTRWFTAMPRSSPSSSA